MQESISAHFLSRRKLLSSFVGVSTTALMGGCEKNTIEGALARAANGPISRKLLSASGGIIRKNYAQFVQSGLWHWETGHEFSPEIYRPIIQERDEVLGDARFKIPFFQELIAADLHRRKSKSALSLNAVHSDLACASGDFERIRRKQREKSLFRFASDQDFTTAVVAHPEAVDIEVSYAFSYGKASFDGPYFRTEKEKLTGPSCEEIAAKAR